MSRVSFDNSALKKLSKKLDDANKKSMAAGFFDSAKYKKGQSVIDVAIGSEYGSAKQNRPPRPFMRPAIEENSNAWTELVDGGINAVLNGSATVDQVLNGLGLKVSADIKSAIVNGDFEALKAETIKRKGQSDPLRDTGIMLASVTHEVN